MYDYFDRKHAGELKTVKQILCNYPICAEQSLKFRDLAHFKNHVKRVHGIRLRT